MLWYAACFVSGIIVGICGSIIVRNIRSGFGTFKINRSDPDVDIYRLELEDDPEVIAKKKYLILRVEED